jgi:hypothetical protein
MLQQRLFDATLNKGAPWFLKKHPDDKLGLSLASHAADMHAIEYTRDWQ